MTNPNSCATIVTLSKEHLFGNEVETMNEKREYVEELVRDVVTDMTEQAFIDFLCWLSASVPIAESERQAPDLIIR